MEKEQVDGAVLWIDTLAHSKISNTTRYATPSEIFFLFIIDKSMKERFHEIPIL